LPDTITEVETFCLRGQQSQSPWGPPYGFVVKITTKDGIVGFGESDTMPEIAVATVEAPYHNQLVAGLRQLLIGTPTEPEIAWRRMQEAVVQYGRDGIVVHAMAAIDIALWDIAGKRAGQPLAKLFGGAARERLRCYGTHHLEATPAETATHAQRLVAEGFTGVKFGWSPLGRDAKSDEGIVCGLRNAIGPSVDLLIDAGMAWDAETAIDRAARFKPYQLFWLEEPLPAYDMVAYAKLCNTSDVPIAAGEMAATVDELTRLMNTGLKILQIDVSRTGLTQALQIARRAGDRGIQVANHTYGYLMNTAASIHLMAVAAHISLFECQTAANELRKAIDMGQLRPKDGWLEVPDRAGLGIDVDEAVLRHFDGRKK
jgi:L-rhamnonate dehydratase